jgi:anti-sigma factor RsiW
MTCQHALSLIEDCIDGDLPSAISEEVARHIQQCPTCRHEYEAAGQMKHLLSRLPVDDPGRDYWSETTRLIWARTIDAPNGGLPVSGGSAMSQHDRRQAFFRAVLSLAASLFVLFSAILMGTTQNQRAAELNAAGTPILATASVSELLGADGDSIVTRDDQILLAKGMLLVGSPTFLGRFAGLADLQARMK